MRAADGFGAAMLADPKIVQPTTLLSHFLRVHW